MAFRRGAAWRPAAAAAFRALAAGLALVWASGPASGRELEVSLGVDASDGKYGQAQSTTIIAETAAVKYIDRSLAVWVSLPYLQTIGPGNVIAGVGAVGGLSPGAPIVTEGIGDVVLGARREIFRLPSTGTIFDLKGKIHFGTAPVSRNLGTGLNDYDLELDATQPVGAGAILFAGFGRRFTGSSPDFPLRDVWYGEIGATYRLGAAWIPGLWLDMRQPSFPGDGRRQEVTASLDYRPAPGWKIEIYGLKGFASGSPAVGGGAIVKRIISF